MKTRITSLFILLIIGMQTVYASPVAEKELFRINKSYNEENILIISSLTDNKCKFVPRNNSYYSFYWLMNGTKPQAVHPLIKSSVESRVTFVGINSTKDTFKIRLNDLKEINHDLEDNIIEVRAEIINGKCEVNSVIKLGASAQYKDLLLETTFCEVKTNMLGVPNGCSKLELKGRNAANTSTTLKATFKGK